MRRKILVVLMLMAAIAAFGSETADMQAIASADPAKLGQAIVPRPHEVPVCFPNEPCGPQR
jgi:hypothetical protein